MEAGDWASAWSFKDAVLIEHAEDPKVLSAVAKVAFANDQRDASADLLVAATRADSFQDAALVKQSMMGMIAVGRLFEGIKLLGEAVQQHPERHESRRWLFDFLCAMENHDAALPHGKYLVRQRQFNFPLLLELSNTEERKLENDSTDQMALRNPDDKRPLLAKAKVRFDRGKFDESERLLREILKSHPRHLPASILLGRVLVDSGRFDQLQKWSEGLSGDYESSWGYWMVLGDWARHHGNASHSARAYWESTRRNPDVMQVWSKLSSALHQLPAAGVDGGEVSIEKIQQRTALLSRLYEQKDRFERSDRKSQSVVVEIVETLRDLGRPWEAEAWAAMAMTLPKEETALATPSDPLGTLRDSLIATLRNDTPWQTLSRHPELSVDLSALPLPSRGFAASKTKRSLRITVPSATPDLRNEAKQRGLEFFGRTRDDLDQPGILIYAELGCGGGAIDYDLDGWIDLYLMAAGGTPPQRDSATNVLQRNRNGQFVNVTNEATASDTGFGQGVAVGDVNEDGFPDLLVLNYGPNRMLINNGDGTFTDVSDEALPNDLSAWSTSGAVADIDGDGLSDLVALNYCDGIDPVTTSCTDEKTGVTKSCAPIHFAAKGDVFFKGSGRGGFVDVTETWEVNPSIVGRGLGVTVGSFDSVPGLDILVANDMTNNHFYTGIHRDRFQLKESAMARGLACDDRSSPQASMGIATSDFDRDGDIDFYVTNFENEYNTYYEQRSQGVWQDSTAEQQMVKAVLPMVGFGSEAIDFDNDGILELVVANGHVHFPIDDDDAEYRQPMQIFRRNRSALFEPIRALASNKYLASLHVGRALWTLDANRDGRTDFVVTHQTEPVALLVNHTATDHHWINLHLRGRTCARDAIGTTVEATDGTQTWTATLTSGDGYLCSNERVIRFGLGGSSSDLAIDIRWPDGSRQTIDRLQVDSDWLIVQNDPAFQFAEHQ